MAKKKNTDDNLMVIARGLSILALGKRFSLAEGGDVQEAFAEIVRTVGASRDHEQRIKTLEAQIARLTVKPKLKVAS